MKAEIIQNFQLQEWHNLKKNDILLTFDGKKDEEF
jgi:hypothetical protein